MKLHSDISVLGRFSRIFRDFQVLGFEYRAQNENPEITENPYFWVYKIQMNVHLSFDHYFKFLSTKTEIYKSDFNSINLDGLEALKRQIRGT